MAMDDKRAALVTGAGSGIGRAIALKFGQEGYRVAATDIDAGSAATTAEAIRARGGDALGLPLDVADSGDAEHGVSEALGRLGRIDVLVNNAGIVWQEPMSTLSDADWARVMGVNLTGAFYMARAVLPAMRERGSGRIINISSVLSTVARPLNGPYAASKGGLNALTRALALEVARDGITVNAVAPGHIKTPLTEPMFTESVVRAFQERIPLGVLGEPEWVADAVFFLASPAARYITGQVLFVDGGFNINGDLPNVEFGQ
jgi:3-oxoacyl-[acyl-carrier protein] reductase